MKRNPTPEEIKSSFRRLALKHHPDRNPDDPFATSKMIDIIEAYEQLTNEDAKNAFEKTVDREYWINTVNTIKFNVGGISIGVSMSLGETGEDWIYGSGISSDASRIYLGCYSGKIYEIDRNGEAKKIYIVPEDKGGLYGQTNPSTNIVERGNYLHIVSYWYLYILRDNRVVTFINNGEGDIRWFDYGFVCQKRNSVLLYLNNGYFLGSVYLKDGIRHICYKNDRLLLETYKKAYLFRLK